MELHHLRTFVIVADEASVTKAAQRLFMTPPTVSSHVRALEDELGVVLFERTARGMKLTEKGRLLKEKAQNTLFAAQDLVNHATNLQGDLIGELAVGLNASPALLRVAALVEALDADYPGISLKLEPLATGKIVDALLRRELDVGFVFGEVDSAEITSRPLSTAHLHIALPSTYANDLSTLTWTTVAQLPWIYTDYACPFQTISDALFAQHALEVTSRIIVNDEQSRLALVKAGVGASLLLADECLHEVESNQIAIWKHHVAQTPLQLAYLTERQSEPLVVALLKSINTVWAQQNNVANNNNQELKA